MLLGRGTLNRPLQLARSPSSVYVRTNAGYLLWSIIESLGVFLLTDIHSNSSTLIFPVFNPVAVSCFVGIILGSSKDVIGYIFTTET